MEWIVIYHLYWNTRPTETRAVGYWTTEHACLAGSWERDISDGVEYTAACYTREEFKHVQARYPGLQVQLRPRPGGSHGQ